MFKWIKRLRLLVQNTSRIMDLLKSYGGDMDRLLTRVHHAQQMAAEAREFIRERTDVSADVHMNSYDHNQIIVVGRYRKRDYVEVFTLPDNELKSMIQTLKNMEKYGTIRHVDAAPGFKAFIDRQATF